MKMLLRTLGILMLATTIPAQDLKSVLQLQPSLSRLNDLFQQFGLYEKLNSLFDITVLAPTNNAIQELEDFGFDFNAVDPFVVQALLTYHVLNGTLSKDDVSHIPQFLPTLLQPPLVTNVSGGAVAKAYLEDDDAVFESGLQKRARSIDTNIPFSGGLVHTIDSTLIFPHNISVTAAVAGMTSFLENVAAAEMVTAIESLADSTVFIPTNQAFEESDITELLGSDDQLVSTLQYHVIPSTVAYSTELPSTSLTTLEGTNLTITVNKDGSIFVDSARIVTPDLLIYGGVAHVIDQVLSLHGGDAPLARLTDIGNESDSVDDNLRPERNARPAAIHSIFYRFASHNVELGGIGAVFLLAVMMSLLFLARCNAKFADLIRKPRASGRQSHPGTDCEMLLGKDSFVHSEEVSKLIGKEVV